MLSASFLGSKKRPGGNFWITFGPFATRWRSPSRGSTWRSKSRPRPWIDSALRDKGGLVRDRRDPDVRGPPSEKDKIKTRCQGFFMSESDRLSIVYASDEDVAVRATGDYAVLTPYWQKLAFGTDGVFAPGDSWTLASATLDFEAAGVRSGHVASLRKPSSLFKGAGELLAVESSSGNRLTLRRIGARAGEGAPPSPAVGASGVEFMIATLWPQIEEASFDLNRRFNIDPRVSGRSPDALRDRRDLRAACVLTVLVQRYAAETRADEGDFALKLRRLNSELSEVLARLELRWNSASGGRETSLFSTRIVR